MENNYRPDDHACLEFENGRLVKVDGKRYQYMGGDQLITLVGVLGRKFYTHEQRSLYLEEALRDVRDAIEAEVKPEGLLNVINDALMGVLGTGTLSVPKLPSGHVVLEQGDTLDGRTAQTIRAADGSEYERIVEEPEEDGEEVRLPRPNELWTSEDGERTAKVVSVYISASDPQMHEVCYIYNGEKRYRSLAKFQYVFPVLYSAPLMPEPAPEAPVPLRVNEVWQSRDKMRSVQILAINPDADEICYSRIGKASVLYASQTRFRQLFPVPASTLPEPVKTLARKACVPQARSVAELDQMVRDLSEQGYRIVSVFEAPADHYNIVAQEF